MNNYEIAELKGRSLFKEFLQSVSITDWQPTLDLYNRVDGYFSKDEKKAVVEIKGRSKCYESFSTHLMEIDKYDAIQADAKNKDIKNAFYACFFGEDVLYLYNTRLIPKNSEIEKKWCPKTTASQSEYCLKDCYMIHKDIASVYIKTNDKWIRQEN